MSVYAGVVATTHFAHEHHREKSARRSLLSRLCEAQNQRCAYCHRRFGEHGERSHATLDHLQPKSHGGRDAYINCVAACANCNHQRGVENPTKYAKQKARDIRMSRPLERTAA